MLNKDIQFTNDLSQVKKSLLSLNEDKDFSVKELSDNKLEFIYDGGYNGVFNHKCTVEIIGPPNNIHDKWFYWKFKVESKEWSDDFEVECLSEHLGFLDFFVDSYIKDLGAYVIAKED